MIKKPLALFFFLLFIGCSYTEMGQANSTSKIQTAISEKHVINGMTKDEVTAAWGKPKKRTDLDADPTAWWYEKGGESWTYKSFLGPRRVVLFKDGIVDHVSIQYK